MSVNVQDFRRFVSGVNPVFCRRRRGTPRNVRAFEGFIRVKNCQIASAVDNAGVTRDDLTMQNENLRAQDLMMGENAGRKRLAS